MYFNIKEAAEYYKCSESHLRGLIYNMKRIPFIKKRGRVMILKDDLDKYKEDSLSKSNRRIMFKSIDYSTVAVEWLELYKQGYSFKAISEKYKCSPETVSIKLKKMFPDFVFDSYMFKLSEEEKKVLRQATEYYYSDSGISLREVCRKFSVTIDRLRSYLKRTGKSVKRLGEERSFCSDHNFFSNIDSEIKAYLLGFFAADGHIEFTTNSYTLKVGVHIKDSHILLLYNKVLCNNKATIRVKKDMASISIGSKQIGEDLVKMGFDNHKTYTWKDLPIIAEEMYPHFIRGYFDGDGSIMLTRRRDNKRLNGYNRIMNIVCFSKSILEQVIDKVGISDFRLMLREAHNKIVQGQEASFKDSYIMEVNNTQELIKIHKYLYNNATYYFKRKKDIFDLVILHTSEIDAALQGNL